MSTGPEFAYYNAKIRGENADPVNAGGSDAWISAGWFHTSKFVPVQIWRDESDGVWVADIGPNQTDNEPEIIRVFTDIMNKGACVTAEQWAAKKAGTPFPREAEHLKQQEIIKNAANKAEARAREQQRLADAETARLKGAVKEADQTAAERKELRGEEPSTPPAGHNRPPIDAITARERLIALYKELQQIEHAGPVDTIDRYELVGKIIAKMQEIRSESETQFEVEKKPHREAGKRVDQAWHPVWNGVDSVKMLGARLSITWINLEKARKAKEESDRRTALQAEAKAAADAAPQGDAPLDTSPPPMAAPTPSRQAKKTGMIEATRKVAEITDLGLVAGYLAAMETPHPDFVDVCRKLARKILDAGLTVPGAKMVDQTSIRA